MNTTIETFNHLKRDVEQSFQRIHSSSSHHDELINHIACTLDDLRKINQILLAHSEHEPIIDDDDNNNREDFIQRMEIQLDSYKKNPIQSTMDTIQLEEENEDQIIVKQDEQFDSMHQTIISLRNLTENINFELDDHVTMLDNLETNMIQSQDRVQHLTKQTTDFVRKKTDGVAGHTFLFGLAVGLFLAIVILLLLF